MGGLQIQSVAVADAADMARNNISAFWREPNWRIMWTSDMDMEFLIAESTKRQVRNLLAKSTETRHQKAVDPATGALVGYARWILPDSHIKTASDDGRTLWPEALAPTVSDAEREQFDALAASAWWEMRPEVEHADDKGSAEKKRLLSERPYLGER